MKVLHYKSNFLNYSETFIHRIIANHKQFEPVAMCVEKRKFVEGLDLYEQPKSGIQGLINTFYFHLNGCLPFYNHTIQRVKPDIVHAHFGFDGYRMIKPALKNNVPFVTGFYGSDVSRLPTEFDWRRRYRKLAESCDAFVAVSKQMKSKLVELGFPKEKIHVVSFGLNLKTFPFSKTDAQERSLMMVGRMVEKKGFKYALQAVKLLREEDIKVQLDLYGDGPLEDKLQQQAREQGLTGQVAFHGYTPFKKVRKALAAHQIALVPSVTASDGDKEGLPNTILEAMASGTSVIASDHAATSEAVQPYKTGLLTPERDAEAIAESIKTILNDREQAAAMKQNARRFIEENHNITDTLTQLEKLYSTVIDRRKNNSI